MSFTNVKVNFLKNKLISLPYSDTSRFYMAFHVSCILDFGHTEL